MWWWYNSWDKWIDRILWFAIMVIVASFASVAFGVAFSILRVMFTK